MMYKVYPEAGFSNYYMQKVLNQSCFLKKVEFFLIIILYFFIILMCLY
jgi:hypothetical protein